MQIQHLLNVAKHSLNSGMSDGMYQPTLKPPFQKESSLLLPLLGLKLPLQLRKVYELNLAGFLFLTDLFSYFLAIVSNTYGAGVWMRMEAKQENQKRSDLISCYYNLTATTSVHLIELQLAL